MDNRDNQGKFIKGHKLPFINKEKRKLIALKNLSNWIGRVPPMMGKKHTDISKKKMSKSAKGRFFSNETRNKLKESAKNRNWNNRKVPKGKEHYKWIEDRTKLKIYGDDNKDRRSSIYNNWRKEIWTRDNWKCKISNNDCFGRIKAHHILGFKKYPELRYNINNGITLCQAHHPRKRIDEQRLIPFFKGLVEVK